MRYRRLKLTVLLLLVGLGIYPALIAAAGDAAGEAVQRGGKRRTTPTARKESRDYSQFKHAIAAHRQQACDACHKFPTANWKTVRKGDAAFADVTDYPKHESCLPCHRAQFFSGAVPTICSNCHTNPSPRDSSRFPFPSLREAFNASKKAEGMVSEYRVNFPHDKHEPLLSEEKKDKNAMCANCHQTYQPQGDSDDEYVTRPPKGLAETAFWLKKGTYKTPPAGHAACFTCHTEDMSPAPKDCGTCHKLMPAAYVMSRRQPHADFDLKLAATMGISDRTDLDRWSRREAGKFRHEWVSHAELSCQDCHKLPAIHTTDPKGPSVAVLSCGGDGTGCHVTPTAKDGGALNLEVDQKKADSSFQCTKCHIQLGKQAVPESHLKALAAMRDKK